MSFAHWAGDPGDEYVKRQTLTRESRQAMFNQVLRCTGLLNSVIEFGASTGENLMALLHLHSNNLGTTGVEINKQAREQMAEQTKGAVFDSSIQNFSSDRQWDMSMTRGVLIHIPLYDLQQAYSTLYMTSRKYILIAEYFSPRIEEIIYRGMSGLLWRGPHAYDMMDRYPDLRLVDYGFVSSRDPVAPQDDVSWFLMEKT